MKHIKHEERKSFKKWAIKPVFGTEVFPSPVKVHHKTKSNSSHATHYSSGIWNFFPRSLFSHKFFRPNKFNKGVAKLKVIWAGRTRVGSFK